MAIGDLLLFISTKSARVSDSAWQASTSNISALAAIVTLVASRAGGDKVGAVISLPGRGYNLRSAHTTHHCNAHIGDGIRPGARWSQI